MLECSSTSEELQQHLEELHHRMGWLNVLMEEAQLQLQACSSDDREVDQNLEEFCTTGTIMSFIEDVYSLYQVGSDFASTSTSDQEKQHFQEKLLNNIAWIKRLTQISQLQIEQVSKALEAGSALVTVQGVQS